MPMPSSYAASMQSNGHTMQSIGNELGYRILSIAHHGQPTIEIKLGTDNESDGENKLAYVTSYSTMDTIQGTVSITTSHDTRFDDIEISFGGTTQVFVDRLTSTPSMSGRTEANHRFLQLKQPISGLPNPRKLVAGKTYTFPFTFTIPAHLLPKACSHQVSNDFVHDAHLLLPPSMGDAELAGFGGTLLDDLAPEMSKIIYGIKVRITKVGSDGAVSLIGTKMRKVRVKPAFEEAPPLNVDAMDPDYRLRQEKNIKKGIFKGKLGTLTAQSAQPKSVVIPGARTICKGAITTTAKVVLRFDPSSEEYTPPRLGSLATKIKVSTFYASAPRQKFPSRATLGYDLSQGVYQESITLSSLCIASAQWEKHTSASNPSAENSLVRRDSGVADCATNATDAAFNAGILTASKNYKGGSFYTAKIIVPVTLPDNKNFLPTFHSCLISRVYSLSLQLSAHAPGVSDPSLHLKVPLQVSADGSDAGIATARARSAEAMVAQEAADIFHPRSMAPPGFDGTVRPELPPDYAAFAPQVGTHGTAISLVA